MFINYLIGVLVPMPATFVGASWIHGGSVVGIFLFGVCIGSFLNCVIYRLEQNKKITGRSFCPHCKHKLSWLDLFPVFSFLLLGGKCRYCKKKISVQYPLVEISTGVLFVVIFWSLGLNWLIGMGIFGFAKLAFLFYIVSALIVILVYDLKHYEIPDKVLFPAIGITIVFQAITNSSQILNYLLAIFIGAGFFFTIFLISKGKWMGFGDVKLAILMGLLLGYPNILSALFVAFFLGAIIGVILMLFKKKGLKSEIPFGPFLVLGTLLAHFFGNSLIQWYLNLFQI